MSRRSILRLVGAVKIAAKADGLGLPLLKYGGSNENFVAECDEDLNISGFMHFDDFDDYEVDYNIQGQLRNKVFQIGDPIPIPYWDYNRLSFVLGDTDPKQWRRMWGNGGSSLTNRIYDLLKSARTGELREIRLRRQDEVIKATFEGVFFAAPNFSRYWLSRFALAAKQVGESEEPSVGLQDALKKQATRWLIEFISKADFLRMAILLGTKESGVFTKHERAEVMYAFFLNKLARGGFDGIVPYVRHPLVTECFPKGLVGYFNRHGWPTINIKYERPHHIMAPMVNAIQEAEKFEYNKNEWIRAEAMAALMFGSSKAPIEIIRMVEPALNDTRETLRNIVNRNPELHHNFRILSRKNPLSREHQDKWVTMLAMTGVIDGEQRMSKYRERVEFEQVLKELEADERFYFPPGLRGTDETD